VPVSDLDIARAVHLWIQRHGDKAMVEARAKVDELRATGDSEGADVWLRIIIAIGTLGEPPTTHGTDRPPRAARVGPFFRRTDAPR
jgi:hypothetical protein